MTAYDTLIPINIVTGFLGQRQDDAAGAACLNRLPSGTPRC